MAFSFSYEPNVYVSGVYPQIVQTGHSFEITGSGVCSATGITLTDGCGGCRHNIPFVTGYGKSTDYCVITGTLPDISPEAFMTLEVANTRSTGTYYPFEVMGAGACILNCEEVIITGNLTVTGDVSVTGDVTYLNPPINNILTGFLAVDGNGKIFQRQIDPTGTTGQYNPGGVVMIAGSGLLGGGDVTLSRRFDVGNGSGTIVSDDGLSIGQGSGIVVQSGSIAVGQGSGILLNPIGGVSIGQSSGIIVQSGSIAVGQGSGVLLNPIGGVSIGQGSGITVHSGYVAVGQGSGIVVGNDGTVGVNTGEFLSTGQGYIDVHASVGLTGNFTIPGTDFRDLQSGRLWLGQRLELGVACDDDTIGFTGVSGDDLAVFTVMDNGITPDKVSFGFAGSNIKSGAANNVSGYISGGLGFEEFVWSGNSKLDLDLNPTGHPYLRNLVYTTGDQVISGLKTFSGQVNISGLEVFGLLTATGDGIFVSDLRITGDVSGAMTMKSLNISGINFTDRYSTTEIMPPSPTQSDGIQIFSMDYTAQATGNYLILDTELNLGAKEMADSVICIFRDSESTPIRAWTQNISNNNQGLVFNMKYFHKAEDTALHTYKIRIGRRETRGYDPIVYINRLWTYPGSETYPYSTGYLGDAAVSSFLISEIKPHPTGSRW